MPSKRITPVARKPLDRFQITRGSTSKEVSQPVGKGERSNIPKPGIESQLNVDDVLRQVQDSSKEHQRTMQNRDLMNQLFSNNRSPLDRNTGLEGVQQQLEQLRGMGGAQGSPQAAQSAGRYEELHPDLQWIIDHESSNRTDARPRDPNTGELLSSAFGIGQLIEANRRHYGAQLGIDPNTQDWNEQLRLMLAYIEDRYGTIQNARRFWEANGHY